MKTLLIATLLYSSFAHAGNRESAMYEAWAGERYAVKQVTIGYMCGVITQSDARFAVQVLKFRMDNEAGYSGVNIDSGVSIQEGMKAAIVAVNKGACLSLTPGDKGRLENFIYELKRSL